MCSEINDGIMLVQVVDDMAGDINVMGIRDVIWWWVESIKYEGAKWEMGSVKCMIWKCRLADLWTCECEYKEGWGGKHLDWKYG